MAAHLLLRILIAYGVANTFFILLQCRPLEASWDVSVLETVQGASCLPQPGIHIMFNIGSGMNIATDIMLSLAPTLFLWKLKSSLKEKILVDALMGLGMIRHGEGCMGTHKLHRDPDSPEQILIMIASSAPFLKPLVQSALHRMGWTLSGTSAGRPGYGNRYHDVRQSARQSRVLNKSAVNSRRNIYSGDEDPFAAGGSNDAIPLEGKVYEMDSAARVVEIRQPWDQVYLADIFVNFEVAGNFTLNHGIFVGETVKLKAKVKDVMHIKKGLLCYEYEDTY
ncbi:uncharacterized protein FSUBG_2970 [Fusarium subglutinans]|uniref:Integral membrane protein n=1 Tax=Gibberella subglutinans TaxID=42677 RepID=A0A8H5Q9J3_GIBSU|nr:uncharacterized protein FSUBG_2970 [Fusarium subglutinans]KAF5610709.1 integral membrane protein [Fusarium subglutinans]